MSEVDIAHGKQTSRTILDQIWAFGGFTWKYRDRHRSQIQYQRAPTLVVLFGAWGGLAPSIHSKTEGDQGWFEWFSRAQRMAQRQWFEGPAGNSVYGGL